MVNARRHTTFNSTDIYQLLCPAISTGTNYHPLRPHQTGHPAVQRRQQDAHLARLPRDADVLLRAAGGGGAALEARWRRGAVRPVQEGERSPVGANGGGTALLPGEDQLGAGAPQVSGRERSRDRGLHCHQAITVESFKDCSGIDWHILSDKRKWRSQTLRSLAFELSKIS